MPKCPGPAKSNEGRWDDRIWNHIHKLSFVYTKSRSRCLCSEIVQSIRQTMAYVKKHGHKSKRKLSDRNLRS